MVTAGSTPTIRAPIRTGMVSGTRGFRRTPVPPTTAPQAPTPDRRIATGTDAGTPAIAVRPTRSTTTTATAFVTTWTIVLACETPARWIPTGIGSGTPATTASM